MPKGDPRWQQIDAQYARIERAMIAKDAKQLFAVYAPDFVAHTLDGEISSFKQSVAYSTAAFDQVKEDISISNTLLDVQSCGSAMLKVTVLQQWSRRQMSHGKLRLYQTVTVQDELGSYWMASGNGNWLRIFVPELGWLISREWIRQSPMTPKLPPLIPTDSLAAPVTPIDEIANASRSAKRSE